MKALLSALFVVSLINPGFSQNAAVDFTATDCAGNPHNFFSELNGGKAIVITWVMPCTACIPGASVASSTVLNTGNPNVKFYLVDDSGDTPCNTLNSWANTNSITANAVFDNIGNLIKMADYGSVGMPKTIVVGGYNHEVFYNYNGTPSASVLQTAIDKALNANTSVIENNDLNLGLTVFPNPVATDARLNYTLVKPADVKIEILDLLGKNVFTQLLNNQAAGNQEYVLNLDSYPAGIYFTRLTAGDKGSQTTRFCVVR